MSLLELSLAPSSEFAEEVPEMSSSNIPVSPTDQYGYVPSKAAAFVFLTLFTVSTVAHITQASKYRTWFMFSTTVLCGLLEILGWAGRAWSGYNPILSTPFDIQIVATIVAPTPLIAANFVIFGRMVRKLGEKYSRLNPRQYTIIFTSCDFVCLLLQGAGGGIAGTANTLTDANKGAHIMLIGIVIQLIIIIIFSGLAVEYLLHHRKDRAYTQKMYIGTDSDKANSSQILSGAGPFTPELKRMTAALSFNMTFLFIRAIYRTIELAGGWRGKVLRTQVYFIIFDGAMVVLALYTTNIVHPGKYLIEPQGRSTMPMQGLSTPTGSDV